MLVVSCLRRRSAASARHRASIPHRHHQSSWPRLLPQQALVSISRRTAYERTHEARASWTRHNRALQRVFPSVLATSTPFASFLASLRHVIRVALHLAKLLGLTLPLAVTAPLVYSTQSITPSVAWAWWEMALWLAQSSSPTVMKFLQWASTRRDLFPASFCDRFETFHEHAPKHSWQQTEIALLHAFGPKWSDIVRLEPYPIGSGCIAQVYRGYVQATNQQVAVKVIHPHVKELVTLDLQVLRTLVALLERWPSFQWLGGTESVLEFATVMERQLNLRTEGENLQLFHHHFRHRRGLRFPMPLMELTTENILVESFEEGLRLHDVLTQLEPSRRQNMARVVLDAYLRMVFLDNFAHGDLHPGNLLFRNPTESFPTAGVVAIDAGIVTKLDPKELRNLVELFHAVATGHGYKAGELMIARSYDGQKEFNARQCTDLESFCKGMEAIVNEALGWQLRLKNVHVGALLRQVLELCCTHHVKLEGKYASIVVSIAVLEAVGRKLDPDINILAVALPIITQALLQNVLL